MATIGNAIARAKSWLFDVTAHNHAEGLRTRRAVERKALGVDVTDLPYPGAVAGSGNSVINNAAGFLKPAILGAALLAGGAAGTLGLTALTGLTQPPSAPQLTPPPVLRDPAKAYDAIYEQQQPDGTWKELKREHLK